MKRILLLVVVAAAIGLALPGVGWAAVAGTPHDVTVAAAAYADFGVCSACHIPHKAYGARLWPSDQSTSVPVRGTVGQLCSYCHGVGSGIYGSAETAYPFKDQKTATHGLLKTPNSPDGQDALTASGLPYTTTTNLSMECTSCHNVHDNAANTQPFLQQVSGVAQDLDRLCAACHPNRQFIAGTATSVVTQGAWGTANMGYVAGAGIGNPGSHPVGTDVYGDLSGPGNSPITTNQIGVGGVLPYFGPAGPGIGSWNLGPHLIDSGTTWQNNNGMGCVTCHAVHGINADDATPSQDPADDLLANPQGAYGSAANGYLDPNNALCEACHRGAVPGFTSSYFPNPGNTALYTHPVDDYYPSGDIGVTGLPMNWPVGAAAGPGAPDLICESCHVPHPLAMKDADTKHTDLLPAAYAGNDSHILRNYDNAICDDCHAGNFVDHHPIGGNLLGGRMVTSTIGDGDVDLECADCHSGAGGHNWAGQGRVGLDPQWRGDPRDCTNATPPGTRFVVNMSLECTGCHTNEGAHFSPTMDSAVGEYQNAGEASHFLGARTAPADFSVGQWPQGGPGLNPDGSQTGGVNTMTTAVWDTAPGNAIGGWSCFGGPDPANGQLVCESCHELEPDKNYPGSKLLLWNYTEALAEPRSVLCEGCHSPQATSEGQPHPMTGMTVSRAVTAQRTATTLITGAGSFAELGAQGDTTYPAVDQMNCDSCHQTHDAYSPSGTYILEDGATTHVTGAPSGQITVGATGAITFTGNWRYTGAELGANKLNYQPFCNLCHASGN